VRFNAVLDDELATLSLTPALAKAVDAQRNKLAGADFSAFAPPLSEALIRAFDRAYVAAFRALMIASAGLAALAAIAGFALIERRREPTSTLGS
jgi:hypothetical protein